jgi:hypothetical protein
MVRVYCRCNSGHYFMGEYCPIDGWSSAASKELTEAVGRLTATGRAISLVELRKAGVSEEAFKRTIVIEFGANDSAFEAISPEGYVIKGEWKPLRYLDERFK